MPVAGTYTLDDRVKAGIAMLEVDCTKCDRYGRRRVDRLIAGYGPDGSLPELKAMLAMAHLALAEVADGYWSA